MTGLLEPAEQHDLDETADMERRRGRIEANIAGDDPLQRERVEAARVGHLVDIAPFGEEAEEIGLIFGHGVARLAWDARGTNYQSHLGQTRTPA